VKFKLDENLPVSSSAILTSARPAPGARRPGRAADDHHAARPDAGHPPHLHLDPEVHLSWRAAPVPDRDREQPHPPDPAADHGRTDFGPHYAETLKIWRDRFRAHADEVKRLGFDEVFTRMWTFYLCYSEAGFRSGYIGVSQLTLARI
jgi:Mycolic acid cyclopropane synthetase